jgi:hypothetical protein
VFRRFRTNLYTQEHQNPLAREEAELLALSTAALRELEGLEDEERRETGGRELVRPLTLIREDGSLAGEWDRSSSATVASVSLSRPLVASLQLCSQSSLLTGGHGFILRGNCGGCSLRSGTLTGRRRRVWRDTHRRGGGLRSRRFTLRCPGGHRRLRGYFT